MPGTGAVIHFLGGADVSSTRVRLVDAALACFADRGLGRTTVDDVARRAGMSRATVYRTLGGGKDAIVAAVVETEVARLWSAVAVAMGSAGDLEDVLVAGICEAAGIVRSHAALARVLELEPAAVTRHLAFGELDQVLFAAGAFGGPFFARWLEPEQAARAAEWATRIVVSYLSAPRSGTDLTCPEDTRRLVRTFVLPGIQALRQVSATGPHAGQAPDHLPEAFLRSSAQRPGDRRRREEAPAP